jgi:NADH-quinone oxidoreductase subunit C
MPDSQEHSFLAKLDGSGLQAFIKQVRGHAGELTIEVAADDLLTVLSQLKHQYEFSYLADIATLDHYTDTRRFEVCYNLVSMTNRQRLRVSVFVEEEAPILASATDIWAGAAWYEREAFDMMGIRFTDNPDLRRIYMPEDFDWFPMRKEFPQLGIPGSIELPEKDPPKPYQ